MTTGTRTARLALAIASVLLLATIALGACGNRHGQRPSKGRHPSVRTTIEVFAAASLTDAFTAMGRDFEVAHPASRIRFTFGASSSLVRQLDGSGADVFASADSVTMSGARSAGLVADPVVFAHNRLEILVGPGNPKRVRSLADLGRGDVDVVLCAAEVPCGRYAAALLDRAGITVAPRSLEENVKGVVAKVTLGEADAGIVYASDVKAAGRTAEGIAVDLAADPSMRATYEIAITRSSKHVDISRDWLAFVAARRGQEVLTSFGFEAP